MSTEKIAALLDGLLGEQLSEEEADELGQAYFKKRAELRGTTVNPEQPKTTTERVAELENRLKTIEQHLGL